MFARYGPRKYFTFDLNAKYFYMEFLRQLSWTLQDNTKHAPIPQPISTAARSLRLISFPLRQVAFLLPPAIVTYTATILGREVQSC
jgi:hypothetical protein